MGHELTIPDHVSIAAHEVLSSAMRLAEWADHQPDLVALEYVDIRTAASILYAILEHTAKRNAA